MHRRRPVTSESVKQIELDEPKRKFPVVTKIFRTAQKTTPPKTETSTLGTRRVSFDVEMSAVSNGILSSAFSDF